MLGSVWYGYSGLGAVIWTSAKRKGTGVKSIQTTIGAWLQSLGKSTSGVLPADGVLGPSSGNALTYLIGPDWYNLPSAQAVVDTVNGITNSFMGDLPGKQDVKDIQAKLNIVQDGELGPATWTKISQRLGSEAWKNSSSFRAVRDAIVLGVPLTAGAPVATGPSITTTPGLTLQTQLPGVPKVLPGTTQFAAPVSKAAPKKAPAAFTLPSVQAGAQVKPGMPEAELKIAKSPIAEEMAKGPAFAEYAGPIAPGPIEKKKLPAWVLPLGVAAGIGALLYILKSKKKVAS